MEFITTFISEYGTQILYMVLVGVFGYIGIQAKALADKYINTKVKKDVARTVVQAVEQLYKDLKGDEKLNKALASASEMLLEKGITVSELEMRMLIEAAVSEFNKAFEKKDISSEA